MDMKGMLKYLVEVYPEERKKAILRYKNNSNKLILKK